MATVAQPKPETVRTLPADAVDSVACCTVNPTIVLAPSTSRFARVMAGVAHRVGGKIDTHITAVTSNGEISAGSCFYRQRIKATLSRSARPWFLLIDFGTHTAWRGEAGKANVEEVAVNLPSIRAPELRWEVANHWSSRAEQTRQC